MFNMVLSKVLLKGFQYFFISSYVKVLLADKNSRIKAERFPIGFPECIHVFTSFYRNKFRANYPQHDDSAFPAGRQAKGFSPSNGAFLSFKLIYG